MQTITPTITPTIMQTMWREAKVCYPEVDLNVLGYSLDTFEYSIIAYDYANDLYVDAQGYFIDIDYWTYLPTFKPNLTAPPDREKFILIVDEDKDNFISTINNLINEKPPWQLIGQPSWRDRYWIQSLKRTEEK